MIAGGVLILFGSPARGPGRDEHRAPAVADAVRHAIAVGDTVPLAGTELRIDAVGDLATKNLDDLGHIVLNVNQPDQKLLPGAVSPRRHSRPQNRDTIEFQSSSS